AHQRRPRERPARHARARGGARRHARGRPGARRRLARARGAPGVITVALADDQAVALAREHRPDVVLMDVRMPRTDGLRATARLTADPTLSGTRVIVLTT